MEDTIFPIEDNFIVARRGVNKDLLASGNRSHMGNPGGEDILYTWLDEVPAGTAVSLAFKRFADRVTMRFTILDVAVAPAILHRC